MRGAHRYFLKPINLTSSATPWKQPAHAISCSTNTNTTATNSSDRAAAYPAAAPQLHVHHRQPGPHAGSARPVYMLAIRCACAVCPPSWPTPSASIESARKLLAWPPSSTTSARSACPRPSSTSPGLLTEDEFESRAPTRHRRAHPQADHPQSRRAVGHPRTSRALGRRRLSGRACRRQHPLLARH